MKQQLSLFNTDVIPATPPRPERRRRSQPTTIDSLCRGFILQWGKDQALEPETMTQLAEKLRSHLEQSAPGVLEQELKAIQSPAIPNLPDTFTEGDMITINAEDWKVLRVGNKHLIVVKGRRGRRRFAYTPATGELRPLSGK